MFIHEVNQTFNTAVHKPFTLGDVTADPIDTALSWANERKMNQSEFARALGVAPQDVTNWKRRGLPAERYQAVADLFGRTVDSLLGRGQPQDDDLHLSRGGETLMAHSVSLRPATMRRRITWEQIMTGADLGDEFETVMEDDSMPERAPRGHIVVWRTDRRPEFGKLVLARDAHGRLHVRRKVQAATVAGWSGVPDNRAFAEFDGSALTVIAVARGVLEP